jgi:hypothetical protein
VTWRDAFRRGRQPAHARGGFDRSRVDFAQSTELGYLNPDRSVTGMDAFGDGATGGSVDGEPYDVRVDLDGLIRTWSAFATDTVSFRDAWSVTLSGRYNRTTGAQSRPASSLAAARPRSTAIISSSGSTGRRRDLQPVARAQLYAGYSEGSRAATSIELGCANPDQPCKLPNAMAGDPPLDQVVTRTWEGARRGHHRGVNWNAGVFRAVNRDDILFVTSDQTGSATSGTSGRTRRRGSSSA